MSAVTIPVMAKCRIGHFAEAQILESLEVDCIDESEGASFDVVTGCEGGVGSQLARVQQRANALFTRTLSLG